MVEEKQRPTGVTVLSILWFVGAVLLVFGGLLLIAGGSAIGAFYGNQIAAQELALFAAAGVVVIIFGLAAALEGWGLWTGRSWAWWVQVVLSALGVLSILSFTADSILDAAISVLVLWYLFKPHVKEFFGVDVRFST